MSNSLHRNIGLLLCSWNISNQKREKKKKSDADRTRINTDIWSSRVRADSHLTLTFTRMQLIALKYAITIIRQSMQTVRSIIYAQLYSSWRSSSRSKHKLFWAGSTVSDSKIESLSARCELVTSRGQFFLWARRVDWCFACLQDFVIPSQSTIKRWAKGVGNNGKTPKVGKQVNKRTNN